MSKNNDKKFEEILKELEDIVAWFDSEDVDLDKSIEKFERGLELSTELKRKLKLSENKIKKIQTKFE